MSSVLHYHSCRQIESALSALIGNNNSVAAQDLQTAVLDV